jgi:hypothetical protein
MNPPGPLISARLFRTGYLPTYAAVAFLLSLVWAGAPGRAIVFDRAWRTADHVGAVGLVLLVLAVAMITIVLQPLQVSMVAVLEGSFPRWLGSGIARGCQVRRKRKRLWPVRGAGCARPGTRKGRGRYSTRRGNVPVVLSSIVL